MTNFSDIVLAFNSLVQQNKFIEALDKFYTDDVVSTDNLNPPNIGITALRKEVENFIENATIEKVELVTLIIKNDLSVTNWYYKFDHKKFGKIDTHQLSVQRWKNNKIIQEHHFYNP